MSTGMIRHTGATLFTLLVLTACASQPESPADSGERRHGALLLRGVPEVPEATAERLRQYQNTRAARLLGWVGNSQLIATRFGDTTQLHLLEEPMGARRQITFFDEPVSSAFLPPGNDDGFIYARDAGGSEFYQLFWFDWATGGHRMLSDGRSLYGGVVWANGGDRFAYYTTERNGRSRDVHVQSLNGLVEVAVEEDEGAWFPEDFAPDDSRMLVSRYVSINEAYLYEVDLATGGRRLLLDADLKVSIRDAKYDSTGTGIFFTSDLGAEFVRLHHMDLASGDIEVLTSGIPWDVEAFVVSEDRRLLAFSVNEGGMSRPQVWRLSDGEAGAPQVRPLALPSIPTGVLSGLAFSADGSQLALSLSGPDTPGDVFSLSLTDRALARWTKGEIGGLDAGTLVTPELIQFETFDRVNGSPRKVPSFVYRPAGSGPHPVLISIHGGPEGQSRPRFSSVIQYLVGELGMAVLVPNVRGSSGYGKSYLKLDNGKLREDSVRDIGALIDWVGTQEDLDPGRVVVMGGSYGGYMVLASLVHYSERLAAGIERVGISNFVTFLENTEAYRRDLRRAEYGDERDPEMRAFLESIAPLNQVEKITRPLLISHGANDPRVPASESQQIHSALMEKGIPVWYVLADNEGHGFRKKANRDYYDAVVSMFLEQYVLD